MNMKNLIFVGLLMATVVAVKGQINMLRYNDDFSYLKQDSAIKTGTDQLKYLPLRGKSTVSFGGEVREQLQYYNNINFGDVPPAFSTTSAWQLWHRLMAHADIEVNKHIRVFTQLGSTFRFINPNPLTPEIEENKLSLHQAFIDYRLNSDWLLRAGRQEVSYGSHRLITFREGPNTRLTFDAAILRYSSEKRKIDLLALSPVVAQKGVFDDAGLKEFLIGFYATEWMGPKAFGVDYYLLNFTSKTRRYNFVSGRESRNVAGFRVFSNKPAANYELEATWQFGTFNDLRINAYSISADINHTFMSRSNWTAGIAANYVTGDKRRDDKQLNTYNLLFSKPQYGLTAPIGATNVITATPYIKANPTKRSSIYAGSSFVWRQSNADGTYSPGAIEMRPTPLSLPTSSKKAIGTLLTLETNYLLNQHIALAFDGSYFFAGNYVRETGKGKNIAYISFKASYKF
jgi:hypothetical protein